MPTLHWIGKEKVINHHLDVPFKVLEHSYGFTDGEQTAEETRGGNKIIHGDNLEALKALLPEYEGRINCIYIDPPYNTGSENWVYNDNVNDPKIQKWINQVVGKEGDDLSRHDKWLCMMYPRLMLLHKLLANDGVIFISIDDNEVQNLRPMLDEIFGSRNRIEQFIWKKSYGGGAKERYAVTVHEYVLLYAKNKENVKELSLPPDDSAEAKYYKLKDEKVAIRGPFRIKPLEATKSMDRRENLVYPINAPDGTQVWPKRQWWWSKERTYAAVENNDLYFVKSKDGGWSISYKQYLRDDTGTERRSKPFSLIDGIYNQVGSALIREIFADRPHNIFQFPKPVQLIEKLISMIPMSKEAIILDSFAGSGTTGHAVVNLNKADGGNRKFILIEMESYAETITSERVKRVINGFADKEGTGGSFDFYQLGKPLFNEDGNLNEEAGIQKIRRYIFYTETKKPLEQKKHRDNQAFLGKENDTAYYFHYDPEETTTLDHHFLATMKTKASQYVVYADNCLLTKSYLTKHNIIFKKIPRDVSRF